MIGSGAVWIAAPLGKAVAVSPEKPDDTISTADKNALSFPVLSDVGHSVGKAFGIVYAFTDELRSGYDGFNLEVVDQVPIVAPPNPHNARYLATKRDKLGHKLPE